MHVGDSANALEMGCRCNPFISHHAILHPLGITHSDAPVSCHCQAPWACWGNMVFGETGLAKETYGLKKTMYKESCWCYEHPVTEPQNGRGCKGPLEIT